MLFVAIVAGAYIEYRSVYSERRRTDAGVFFRAGYAVRAGLDPATVPDDNEWYFIYPPGVAVGFVPLADPPRSVESVPRGGVSPSPVVGSPAAAGPFVPYAISVAVWYVISVACLVLSIELLVRTLIRGSPDPLVRALRRDQGGWWNLRLWPLFMVLPDALSTLSRGQINLVVVACISAGIYCLGRRRRFWGGWWLAAAAGIKVIPGVIVFDVLSRRGGRAIAGYAVCGVFLMVVLPVVAFGPAHAWEYTQTFVDRVLLAGLRGSQNVLQAGSDPSDFDNHSFQGALHNVLNIATPRGERPGMIEPWVKVVHVACSLAMLAASVLIGTRPWGRVSGRGVESALEITLRIGMLCCVMVLASPMSHRHYFVFTLPALAALVYMNIMRSRLAVPQGWGAALIAGYIVLQTIPRFVDKGVLRDLPIPTVLTVVVWGACAAALLRIARESRAAVNGPVPG